MLKQWLSGWSTHLSCFDFKIYLILVWRVLDTQLIRAQTKKKIFFLVGGHTGRKYISFTYIRIIFFVHFFLKHFFVSIDNDEPLEQMQQKTTWTHFFLFYFLLGRECLNETKALSRMFGTPCMLCFISMVIFCVFDWVCFIIYEIQ